MKYFSTFSGIGGFELGIEQAYVDISRIKKGKVQAKDVESMPDSSSKNGNGRKQHPLHSSPECIGYSEIDKYAIQIYEKNFNHTNYGDIAEINAKKLPNFDLFVGGFPCQSFSIAGKRAGFKDTRGTMFFEIARIVREKQPRLLLLENVKGLLSHDKGATFKTIISTLDELGYDLQWQVLNSKNHGVPQNRERVFIIGHLRGTPRPKVFPFFGSHTEIAKTSKGELVDSRSTTPVATALDANYHKGHGQRGKSRGRTLVQKNDIIVKGSLSNEKWDKFNESSRRVYDPKGIAPTVPTSAGGGHMPKIHQRPRGKNKGGVHSISPTLTGKSFADNNHINQIRRLTPTECERLQGFPDGWTETGMLNLEDRWCPQCKMSVLDEKDCDNCGQYFYDEEDFEVKISDTQRYKTLGNAVTVNVIRDIMMKLL